MQGRSLLSASTAIKIKSNQPAIRETKGFFLGEIFIFAKQGYVSGIEKSSVLTREGFP